MVSLCTVTMNRTELTKKCIAQALNAPGAEYELLWGDNGSDEQEVKDFMAGLGSESFPYPDIRRKVEVYSPTNIGYAKMLNRLRLKAEGDYICIIDPDIYVPDGWLGQLVAANNAIANSGVSSLHCVQDLKQNLQEVNGVKIYPQEEVYGIKFYNRAVVDKVGYYCEEYPAYGSEDVEFNRRCIMAGLINYYVEAQAYHLGEDSADKTPYRQMKWDLLKVSHEVLARRFEYLANTGDYYVGPPEAILW